MCVCLCVYVCVCVCVCVCLSVCVCVCVCGLPSRAFQIKQGFGVVFLFLFLQMDEASSSRRSVELELSAIYRISVKDVLQSAANNSCKQPLELLRMSDMPHHPNLKQLQRLYLLQKVCVYLVKVRECCGQFVLMCTSSLSVCVCVCVCVCARV